MRSILLFSIFLMLLTSCSEEVIHIPKPRIYPKITFPERSYSEFTHEYCSFRFEHPTYMSFKRDTVRYKNDMLHPCWFNLEFASLNGDVHFTYTDIRGDSLAQNLHKVYNDAYRLAQEHNRLATANEDFVINNPEKKVYGVLFNIEGHVASPFQLVLTDSVNHAVRASLYFNCRPDADSMQPVIEFVKADIMGILNTFEWGTPVRK